jgi:hypothetical protein
MLRVATVGCGLQPKVHGLERPWVVSAHYVQDSVSWQHQQEIQRIPDRKKDQCSHHHLHNESSQRNAELGRRTGQTDKQRVNTDIAFEIFNRHDTTPMIASTIEAAPKIPTMPIKMPMAHPQGIFPAMARMEHETTQIIATVRAKPPVSIERTWLAALSQGAPAANARPGKPVAKTTRSGRRIRLLKRPLANGASSAVGDKLSGASI